MLLTSFTVEIPGGPDWGGSDNEFKVDKERPGTPGLRAVVFVGWVETADRLGVVGTNPVVPNGFESRLVPTSNKAVARLPNRRPAPM